VNWFHFVSLTYWKQLYGLKWNFLARCELVSFCIFDVLKTTHANCWTSDWVLWIGFILYLWRIENNIFTFIFNHLNVVNWFHFVSLTYWKQPYSCKHDHYSGCELVSFCIFDVLKTTNVYNIAFQYWLWIGFILYLWRIENNYVGGGKLLLKVVNWFHFVSLTYWKQLSSLRPRMKDRCELVSFCIFDVLKTTLVYYSYPGNALWIGFILYLWRIENNLIAMHIVIKLLWIGFILYLWRIENNTFVSLIPQR